MSIEISEEARTMLRAAGWSETRQVDIEPLSKHLAENGFELTPLTAEFLRAFHGLEIRTTLPGGLSFVRFDAWDAVYKLESQDQPYLDRLVDSPLCPIGSGGRALLFLSASGQLIAVNDQWFGFSRSPTIFDGMDAILGVRRPAETLSFDLGPDQKPEEFR